MAQTRAFLSFRTVWLLGCVLAGLAAPATGARAHDIKEMTIAARVHADRIDLVVVASNHMAATLLAGPEGKPPVLTPVTFAALHPALEAQGKKLCLLSSGEDKPRVLAPTSIDVLLGQEDEVEFYLVYPPAAGGTLRLEAAALARLEAGYTVNLKVLDAKRKPLASQALTRDEPGVTISLGGEAAANAAK